VTLPCVHEFFPHAFPKGIIVEFMRIRETHDLPDVVGEQFGKIPWNKGCSLVHTTGSERNKVSKGIVREVGKVSW
jgi:hypothetical protein